MILLSIEISMLPKPPWMVMVFDCSRWAPKRWHQGPGFEIPNPGCDILFLTKDWDWSSLFPVCSWICNSHSHLHGCSYCARSVKFWNKRWKVWSSGWEVRSSVDDRFWSETIHSPSSLEFLHFSYRETVSDLWWNWRNSGGTLGKGDFVSLFEAQVFHIIVCSEQQEVTDCSRKVVVARYFIMWLI